MSHVFPRHTKNIPPKAVRGEGCYLFDETGKAYLDGSGGAAVSCISHNDEDIIAAIHEQTANLAYAHTSFFSSKPAEELANVLSEKAPDGLDKVYFVSGGSEAIEAAIKLARQYYVECGENQRERIIARRQSYHGNTLGALAVGGNSWRRKQFAPLLIDVSHIAPCYEYIMRNSTETVFDYGQRAAKELEDEILRVGDKKVMAFIAEPVVGATLGAVPAVNGYFKKIREICNKYGVLLILDEVMCGMGRTGHLFACEADAISPDILCIAKGLGAGYQPIGAMMCTSEVYNAVSSGSGFFQHGHTYLGHPVATAAANAVLKKLTEEGMMKRVIKQGKLLSLTLKNVFSQNPHIGDIRGRGLFQGIELVEDYKSKMPFNPENKLAQKIKTIAFEEGLICYPMSGTRDGRFGDHVLLAPPFIIKDHQIDELVIKLSRAVELALKETKSL